MEYRWKNGITMNVYGVHYRQYMEGEQKNWNAAAFGTAIMKEKSRADVGGRIEPHDVEPLRKFEKSIFEAAKKIMPELKRFY